MTKTKENEINFILLINLCLIASLLIAFVLTLAGVIDLKIINVLVISEKYNFWISYTLFMVNMALYFGIVFKIFDVRILYVLGFTVFYIPLYHYTQSNFFTTSLAIFLYLFGLNVLIIKSKDFLLRFTVLHLFICAIYQPLTGFIKMRYTVFNIFQHYSPNAYACMLYSLDLFIFLLGLNILTYREVQIYELVVRRIFTKKFSFSANKNADKEVDLTPLQDFVFKCFKFVFFIFQFYVIVAIGGIFNLKIEATIMALVFILGKAVLKKCWHGSTLIQCCFATFIGFFILIRLTLPFAVSLFMTIALAAIFAYIMYRAGVLQELFDQMRKTESFYCNTATEEEMRKRCRELGKSEEYENFCVRAFVKRTRRKEIAQAFEYTEETTKTYIKRYRKELERVQNG